jgi:hypothetical protein
MRTVLIIDQNLRDGQVLGSAAARRQSGFRDGDIPDGVGCGGVGRGIVDEEPEDEGPRDDDEDAGPGEEAVREAGEGAVVVGEGFGRDQTD